MIIDSVQEFFRNCLIKKRAHRILAEFEEIQQVAEAEGYEDYNDYLDDAASEIRSALSMRGIHNVDEGEIIELLIDELGDRDKVLQGFLED